MDDGSIIVIDLQKMAKKTSIDTLYLFISCLPDFVDQ
jgi:hypothetical protein